MNFRISGLMVVLTIVAITCSVVVARFDALVGVIIAAFVLGWTQLVGL